MVGPSFGGDANATLQERRADGLKVYFGIGGSPGLRTGIVRSCATLKQAVKELKQGDILVTQMTSPAWTPCFSILGGVITEHGGRLSHAAVVARECGLPAVLGLEHATKHFLTGSMVQIDGGLGQVTVLSVASLAARTNNVPSDVPLEEKVVVDEEEVEDLSRSRDDLVQSRNN